MKLLFRIRGIYSTALTKLLISRGLYPTQASRTIRSRFKLDALFDPPDVDIYDAHNREGLMLEGCEEGVRKVSEILLEELPDVLVKELKPDLYSVYEGVVEENVKEGCLINLGEALGLLPKQRLNPGERIVVTVIKCSLNGPIVALGLRVMGKYCKLLPGESVILSYGIKDLEKAAELLTFGKMIKPKGYGLQLRRSALYASSEKLMDEVKELVLLAEEALKKARAGQAPSLIMRGVKLSSILFAGGSRSRLDDLRRGICFTVPRHHLIKMWGRPYSMAVDILESLHTTISNEALEKASDLLLAKMLKSSKMVEITHVKPDGRFYSLRPGRIIEVKDGEVAIERRFRGGGVYDGLGEVKEDGDYGITKFREGSWVASTTYYSKDGSLKGVYYNILTPPEFTPRGVKYVDLLIDVVWTPKSGVKVVDEEELKEMARKGFISKKLENLAFKISHRLAKEVSEAETNPIDLSRFISS